MNERCPDCGALFVLVGLRHRCTPRPDAVPVKPKRSRPVTKPVKTKGKARKVTARGRVKKG
jgi:hypothetical protein